MRSFAKFFGQERAAHRAVYHWTSCFSWMAGAKRDWRAVSAVAVLAVACEPYGSCDGLAIGDRLHVTITHIQRGSDCRPSLDLGEGTVLDLTVTDLIRDERCISATGTVVSLNSNIYFSGGPGLDDDTDGSGFYGSYRAQTDACMGAIQFYLNVKLDGSRPSASSIRTEVSLSASQCGSSECSFDADAVARRL